MDKYIKDKNKGIHTIKENGKKYYVYNTTISLSIQRNKAFLSK